jgi:hypothetical protein
VGLVTTICRKGDATVPLKKMMEKAEQFFSLWKKTFAHDEESRWVNYLAGGTFRPTRPIHKTDR